MASTSVSVMSPVVVFVLYDQGIKSTQWSRLITVHAEKPCHRNYSINQRQLFDENYALAATQSLKNKDIPEGGAKGTILPSYVPSFSDPHSLY